MWQRPTAAWLTAARTDRHIALVVVVVEVVVAVAVALALALAVVMVMVVVAWFVCHGWLVG